LAAIGEEFAKPYFAELRKFVSEERRQFDVFPPAQDVFNAFRFTPLTQVRVVILGQDPYPTPGHAHGLCFSVRPGVTIPASLRNIYRELEADLKIPPANHGYLEAWARQGILLLNTVLTVRSGSPNSHKGKGWEYFTDAALAAVNQLSRRVVFLLWGSHAKQKAKRIDAKKHAIITGVHPSPMSADNGFFGSKPFSQVNEALEEAGQPPIDWKLPDVVR
jgi:uracil-DNA glycosylase